MKKVWLGLFTAVAMATLFASFATTSVSAQDVEDFTINSFTADYYLSRTKADISQMTVDEVIVANFPQYDQNHGILRAIPESYQNHTVSLKVQSVTNVSGQKLPYTTYSQNGNLVLQIGSANAYVHGEQTYRIDYSMQNVTADFASDDELYWNVNGDQWDQTMNTVTARLHLTKDLTAQYDDQLKCFAGADGTSDSSSCTIASSAGNTLIAAEATRPLNASETLTFVAGFKPGAFAKYHASLAHIVAVSAILGGPVALAAAFVFWRWRLLGRDPKGQGTVVVQYVPPKEASVLVSGLTLKERPETKHISAQIIDLAVRHYVRIYQTSESRTLRPDKIHYQLELIKSLKDLRPEERTAAEAIFVSDAPNGMRVNIDDLSRHLSTQAKTTGALTAKEAVNAGFFVHNPTVVRTHYVQAGIALFVVALLTHTWYTFGVGAAGLIIWLSSRAMSARTAKGVALRDYLFGLKEYMQVAEADRIRALQSPSGELTEKTQINPNDPAQLVKLYERLLPFAMLFGIEKDWAKQFAPLYKTPPDWFVGNWAAFDAGYFAGSLASFSNVAQTAFTAPSGSSGSGFGGGGFAGGGGGGGGGGGW